MPHDVIMPALGMAQDTGLIVSWLKQPGDAVRFGEALMEVETDKAVMEVEAQADGFLTGVSAAAGDHVPVGQVVAVIAETADAPAGSTPPDPTSSTPPQSAEPRPGLLQESLPTGSEIIMPALGMAQDTGLIVAWRKTAGDAVAASDILLDVETDKSVMEVEAGHDGFVAAILADAQQAVPVGSVIAIITKDKPEKAISRSHATTPADPGSNVTAPAPDAPRDPALQAAISQKAPHAGAAPGSAGRILASPKARRIAMEKGVDLALLAEHGVPQPYHVADLSMFETLGAPSAAMSEAVAPVGAADATPMHISARVAASGCDEFIAWMADDGNITLEPRLMWLRFAAAALREASGRQTDTLIIETTQLRKIKGRFSDADRSRLSKPVSDASDLPPSLVLRDFSGSPITTVTGSTGSAPVLTIGRERDDYVISLDYRADQLNESQAIDFVTGFAERLCEPLRHLL